MLNYANTRDLESSLAGSTVEFIDLLDDMARDVRAWADTCKRCRSSARPSRATSWSLSACASPTRARRWRRHATR